MTPCVAKGYEGEALFSLWFYKTKGTGQRVTSSRLPPAEHRFLPKKGLFWKCLMSLFLRGGFCTVLFSEYFSGIVRIIFVTFFSIL